MPDEKQILNELGGEEEYEIYWNTYVKTGYPKPIKRYHLIWESPFLNIEEPYYWIVKYLRYDASFPEIIKIRDIFSAAELSAFFGVSQQRLGIQQDKVSGYLATIGKMTRELFQLVRELRILDERLEYYEKAKKGDQSAEIVLKGYWIDLVEGGSKNPGSVYGMAREVQFLSLPDLFFSTPPIKSDEVDEFVDKNYSGFNKAVRNVLKRKLKQFITWKEHTYKEIQVRRKFTLQYLRQHFDIIKMYMDWVRPYLKYIRRMHYDVTKLEEPEIVSAFEAAMLEVELLARKKFGNYYACLLATFIFSTKPQMSFVQEGYQRGPLHVGKMDLTLRAYVWTEEQVKKFIEMKNQEDFKLISLIDESLKAAMEALGDKLVEYLKEAGERIGLPMYEEKKPEEKPKKESLLRKLFKDFLPEKKPEEKPKPEKKKKISELEKEKNKSDAKKYVKKHIWNLYKNFKKGHGMIQW